MLYFFSVSVFRCTVSRSVQRVKQMVNSGKQDSTMKSAQLLRIRLARENWTAGLLGNIDVVRHVCSVNGLLERQGTREEICANDVH